MSGIDQSREKNTRSEQDYRGLTIVSKYCGAIYIKEYNAMYFMNENVAKRCIDNMLNVQSKERQKEIEFWNLDKMMNP